MAGQRMPVDVDPASDRFAIFEHGDTAQAAVVAGFVGIENAKYRGRTIKSIDFPCHEIAILARRAEARVSLQPIEPSGKGGTPHKIRVSGEIPCESIPPDGALQRSIDEKVARA